MRGQARPLTESEPARDRVRDRIRDSIRGRLRDLDTAVNARLGGVSVHSR